MGRYAEFSTMFSYKFLFAKQSSNDITLFGGECMSLREDDGQGWWRWNQEDVPQILAKLNSYPHTLPDFTKFENNCKGTAKLCESIETCNPAFVLGALIYHQLLYTENLTAMFEF
jgi:hypothetical protein